MNETMPYAPNLETLSHLKILWHGISWLIGINKSRMSTFYQSPAMNGLKVFIQKLLGLTWIIFLKDIFSCQKNGHPSSMKYLKILIAPNCKNINNILTITISKLKEHKII